MHVVLRRPSHAVRALAVGVLTGVLALVPGAALAHGHQPHRHHVNHAPERPSDVGTTAPDTACSTDAAAALRSGAPTLRATLTDPDGDVLRAAFEVRDGLTGRSLWRSTTTGQASGAQHAVQVPERVMRDGRTYEWRVQARDARNRTSPTVRCRVVVDVTAPGTTQVTALDGAGARYAEDTVAGGIGVAGDFRFEAQGSGDVVAFLYVFDGSPARVEVAPGAVDATVRWVPTSDGPHQLTVQAVDGAGNVGPERLYRFTVASAVTAPTGNARWGLDEGAGASAADALAEVPGAGLTLSASTSWTDGYQAEVGGVLTDRALLFDEPTDAATTAGPVIDTTGSFSVAVVARVDGEGTATTVSQDASVGGAFALGTSTTACGEDVATCWSFEVAGDGSSVVATSAVPVAVGSWYGVFGVRDAATGVVRVDVCDLGSAQAPGSPSPRAGAPAALADAAASSGPLRVGSGRDGALPWRGAVSGIQTWGGVIDVTRERLICSRGL